MPTCNSTNAPRVDGLFLTLVKSNMFNSPTKIPWSDDLGLSENWIRLNWAVFIIIFPIHIHIWGDIRPGSMTTQYLSCSWVAKANLQGQPKNHLINGNFTLNGPSVIHYTMSSRHPYETAIQKSWSCVGIYTHLGPYKVRFFSFKFDGIKMGCLQTSIRTIGLGYPRVDTKFPLIEGPGKHRCWP